MEKPWYFIQLSDTHIVADTRQESHGVNTYATLSRAITQINHLDPPPAFAIFTGDLINDDDPHSYRVLQQLTDQLCVPAYFAMGNHDKIGGHAELVSELLQYAIGVWVVIIDEIASKNGKGWRWVEVIDLGNSTAERCISIDTM